MVQLGLLRAEREPKDGGALVDLTGELDSDTDVTGLAAALDGDTLVDAGGVERFTSQGARHFAAALERRKDGWLGVHRARPAFMVQLNTTPRAAEGVTLVSFFLPYLCDRCGDAHERLLDVRADYAAVQLGSPPEHTCHKCHGPMTLDAGPDYFGLAAARPEPRVPAWAERLLPELERGPRELRVLQDPTEDVTGVWLDGEPHARTSLGRLARGLEGMVAIECSGLPGASKAHAARLAPLFERARDGLAWVARLRPQALAPLPHEVKELLAGRVIDALVPAHCDACEEDVEARVTRADLEAADAAPVSCPACGGDARLLLPRTGLAPLRRFLTDEPDPDVLAYLAERPAGPEGNEATGPRYEVLRPLGFGGMAEVSLAKQRGPAGFVRSVALKRILPEYSHDRSFVRMFLREARVAARLAHPNVVQIYDLGREQGRYFIAMELVRGWDLSAVLRAVRAVEVPFPLELAAHIVSELLEGLGAAHECRNDAGEVAPILHRDVSPQNVLLSSSGEVKLTDFGVAKASDLTSFSQPGSVKGKIYYVSPERIDGRLGPVDGRSDLFAAGLLLYEMLAGFAPFRRKDNIAAMRAVLDASAPDLAEQRADLPADVVDVVHKAMARTPRERYATAGEMRAALGYALERAGRKPADARLLARFLQSVEDEARAYGEGMGPVLPSRGSLAGAGEVEEALKDLSLSLSVVVDDGGQELR